MAVVLTTAVLLHTPILGAQAAATTGTFYTPRDALWAAGFAATSAGLSVFDARIAHFFRDTSHTHVHVGRKLDHIFTRVNETTLTIGGIVLYGVGRLSHNETLAEVSLHSAESVAAASLTAQLVRGPLGRTRPIDEDPPYENPYEFHFLKGFTHFERRAFPSIHSSSGFAAASAVVAEVEHRAPGAKWWVGVPAYALALTPGLSRMYMGQHWATDIFAGAALGAFYGWRVVDYSHAHARTPVDRFFLGKGTSAQNGVPRSPPTPFGTPFSFGWRITF